MESAIIYLFIVFFLLALTTDALPFLKSARIISTLSQSSIKTIQASDVDDDQKQSILLKNSLGIFKESFKITLFTALLVALLLLALKASSFIMPLNYNYLMGFLVSTTGILLSIIAFISYFVLKKLYGRLRV